MSRHEFDVATLATVARLGLMSRHGIDVATWTSVKGGRDMKMMSRHRLVFRMSRHGVDVAT